MQAIDRRGTKSAVQDAVSVGIVLLLFLAVEAIVLFYLYLPQRRSEALRRAQSQLAVVVADRQNAVTAWAQERAADAEVAATNLAVLAAPQREAMLKEFVQGYRYEAVFVVDERGETLLQYGTEEPANACITEFAKRARHGPGAIVDFCEGAAHKPEVLSAAAFDDGFAPGRSRGAVIFAADPAIYLYPMLNVWAAANETGEVGLGRIEGDLGVILTPMRHQAARPMSFKRPVEATIVGEARRRGSGLGLRYADYRGVPVLGELRPIEGTPWLLIGKMDEAEALAPALSETARLGVLVALAFIMIATGAFSVLRSRRVHDLRVAEEQFRELFEHSMNAISIHEVIFDAKGNPVDQRFIGGNPALERVTGVPIAERIGSRTAMPNLIFSAETTEQLFRVAMTGEPLHTEQFNESVQRWFDTTVFSPRRGQFVLVFSDITERKRNEGLLRALSESSLVGVLSHQGNTITYANQAAASIFGYTTEEAIGADLMTFIVPEDAELISEGIRRRLSGDEPQDSYEFRARCKDGGLRSVRLFARRAELEGHPLVIANVLDVTAQRAAENAFRASEERFRTIVETSYEGIAWLDADFRLTYVNRRLAEMFLCAEEQLLGRTLYELVSPGDLSTLESELANRRRGMTGQYDCMFLRSDGTPIVCAISAVPIRGDGGEFSGSLAMMTDITERVAADRQVRRLARAVSQLREGIVVTAPTGTIEYVNPANERMTGYSEDEVLGRNWCDDAGLDEGVWHTVVSGASWEGLLTGRRKDGAVIEEEVTISPVHDRSGKIMNVVAVRRDVTRERSLLAQLHQAQKLEAVGTLAGGVAHDFNNLLMGLGMTLQVASAKTDSPAIASMLAELQKLVRRGASLTRQLLLFSRESVAKRELVDLNEVVREASGLLRRLIRENISFDSDLADAALPVKVDSAQMEQVLVNLVVNAADAMPSGGTLRVATQAGERGQCTISIEDSGHGIPQEIRDRIFDPFFTTKSRDRGTGLGLSVVHGIVGEHGGTITFADREEGGTRFVITLPRAPMAGNELASASGLVRPLPKGRGERVLVVEDERAVREGLVATLAMLDYRAHGVASGAEALHVKTAEPFDLVLTDVVLPDLPGPRLLEHLRSRWPGVKSVLMSGYTNDPDLRRKAEAGTLLVLNKPFEIAELAATLYTALAEPSQ